MTKYNVYSLRFDVITVTKDRKSFKNFIMLWEYTDTTEIFWDGYFEKFREQMDNFKINSIDLPMMKVFRFIIMMIIVSNKLH